MVDNNKTYETAVKRWEGIGPYYAMFPIRFADSVIKEYTSPGDTVLDPFAGRGTSVFSATSLGRYGFGIEISPVGWIYAKAKLDPAPLNQVEEKLLEIAAQEHRYSLEAEDLPVFFKKCFSSPVCRFLLAARVGLNWRDINCDRTLMAIILIYLHGKEGQALSNQMRQTKAMSPHYAIKWWTENGKNPPVINVVDFLRKRIRWRYAKGIIQANCSEMMLGNSIELLPQLEQHLYEQTIPKAKLLLTSPPYYGFTNYHYDQWIRLWLLGFETDAYVSRGPHQGRFTNREQYQELLSTVFASSANLLANDAIIYVRTSKESITRDATLQAINNAFPNKQLYEIYQPFKNPTQTHLFGDKTRKAGEVDLILQ